jgi:hypothetical protein
MDTVFDLRLAGTARRVQVRYPLAASATVLLPALSTLLLIRLAATVAPRGDELWPLALGLWLGLTGCQLGRLLWWSPVTFDRERRMVLRGPMTLARLEDLLAIERGHRLVLVFRAGRDGTWRWSMPRMSVSEASRLGGPLAAHLGVPLIDRKAAVSVRAG